MKRRPDRIVRIIGGNWRGRKVSFAQHDDIRPTPARIRETLFNWLQNDIHGARCLEPYAGSGILSIEALSRGAAQVTLVDQSARVIAAIREALVTLDVEPDRYTCHTMAASRWLASANEQPYDVVFLDPPFASSELVQVIGMLDASSLLACGARIYIESARPMDADSLPAGWQMHRQKRAGQVHYCLAIAPAQDDTV